MPGGAALVGRVHRPVLNGVWFNAVLPTRDRREDYGAGSYGGDANAAGSFRTVVRFPVEHWPETIGSDLLDQLRRRAALRDGHVLLSLKFVLDGYDNVPRHADARYGRIVGTLGPAFANEPTAAPGPRWLYPRALPANADWFVPTFNGAPFKLDVDRRVLVVDLANSLCRRTPGGDPVDLGELRAVVDVGGERKVVGTLDYSAFAYDHNAQVAEVPLADADAQLLAGHPLSRVVAREDLGPRAVLTEDADGFAFAVKDRVARLPGAPGTRATARVHVT